MRTLQRRLVRVAEAAVAVVVWGAVIVAPTGASAATVTFDYTGQRVDGGNVIATALGSFSINLSDPFVVGESQLRSPFDGAGGSNPLTASPSISFFFEITCNPLFLS